MFVVGIFLFFGTAQEDLAKDGAQAQQASGVTELDGLHYDLVPPFKVTVGVDPEESQEAVQVFELVLDGRTRDGPTTLGVQSVDGTCVLGGLVLDHVGFVEDDAEPLHAKELGVGGPVFGGEGRVGGKDDVALGQVGGFSLSIFVVDVDAKKAALDFASNFGFPLAKHGKRANDQCGL
jgi:hypothetical protein